MTSRIVSSRARSLAACALAGSAMILLSALPASAQGGHSVSVDAADSVSFIVPRRAPSDAEASLRTHDRRVALILRDTVVVLQLTDRGMDELFDGDTTTRGAGGAIFARMVRAGVSGLLDHGIAYRVSALRRAYVDGNELVLEDRTGKRVFEDTKYNDHRPMQEFDRADAERFAKAVQRAIAQRK